MIAAPTVPRASLDTAVPAALLEAALDDPLLLAPFTRWLTEGEQPGEPWIGGKLAGS